MNKISKSDSKTSQQKKRHFHLSGGASACGHFRQQNEDALVTGRIPYGGSFMVVCDGVGGLPNGKEAAELASSAVASYLSSANEDNDLIAKSIFAAEEALREAATSGCTTVVVAVVRERKLDYGYVGDGALNVLYSNGQVLRLLSPHRPASAPENHISQCLNSSSSSTPTIGSLTLEDGCAVFAMSDGASDLSDGWFPAKLIGQWRVRRTLPKEMGNVFVQNLIDRKDDEGEYLHSDNVTAGFIFTGTIFRIKQLEAAYAAYCLA